MLLWLTADGVDAQAQPPTGAAQFAASDRCIACHSNMHSQSGEDVSIGYAWRASMMANSARDPYWLAAVRREVIDHPRAQSAIEDKCATCHMPMARYLSSQGGGTGEVFANMFDGGAGIPSGDETELTQLARDGVSCTVCHQMTEHAFGEPASFTGGFRIASSADADGRWRVFGPHDIDAGRTALMRSAASAEPAQAVHLARSELCATCHTLYTHALDEDGREIGELAEQVPYLEWRHSDFRQSASCQDCHMPELADATPISSVLGEPRERFSQHVFRGGNAFMLGVLNKYRDELGVTAPPQEFSTVIRRTREYLGSAAASIALAGVQRHADELAFDVIVTSTTGHKLPTAYPSRRVWLHVVVEDSGGDILFESGRPLDTGAIEGNDNDIDAARFEPHYDIIETADQVQIWEPILADVRGEVTTGLLRAVRYVKDNRILPAGFEKTSAANDIAVAGRALEDADFVGGGDAVKYRLALDAAGLARAASIRATLFYQSVGFRWAANLRDYRAFETDRFVRYYEESIRDTAVTLARATADLR